jgi:molybdopterin-guanine dinucleotide biosynthesis protein B
MASGNHETMHCVHIVGRKNHGKTTLIVELIEHYTRRGLRVGSVKHSSHAHELDQPGKDSHRHRLAGAQPTTVVTADLIAVFQPRSQNDFYQQIQPLYEQCDLVLVEGDIDGRGIKAEVWRRAVGGPCLAHERQDVAAVISDDQPRVEVPVWPRHDLEALADRLLELI